MPKKLTYDKLALRIRKLEIENNFLRRQFLAVVENSMDAILLTAPDGRIFSANRAACDLYQMTEKELVTRGRSAVVDPEDKRLADALAQRARTGRFRGELNQKKEDGTVFPAEISSAIFRDAAGLEFTSMIVRDLTERKRIEADLLAKVRLLESMNTVIEDAVIVSSMDMKIVGINAAALKLFEYASDELVGRSTEILHVDHDHFNEFGRTIDEAFQRNEKAHFAFGIKTKSGKVIPTEHNVSTIRNDTGHPIGIISIVKDRSRIVELEDNLTETQFKLNLVTDTIDDVIWMSTAGVGKMLYVSAAYETLWERSRESLYQNPRSFMDAVHPEDRDRLSEIITTCHQKLQGYECEYRIVRKNGEIRWIYERGFPVSKLPDKVMTGICTDITDRKIIEETIQLSEETLRLAQRIGKIRCWRYRIAGKTIDPNSKDILFFSEDAPARHLSHAELSSRIDPEDAATFGVALDRAIAGEGGFSIELRTVDEGGGSGYALVACDIFSNEQGQVVELIGIIQDITATRDAERAREAAEQRYRSVVEDQTEIISRLTIDGTLIFVNNAYCRFFGKNREELIGRKWQPCAHPDDVPTIERQLSIISPESRVKVVNNRVFRGDGEIRWVQFINRGIFNADNELIEIQSVGRDITELKATQQSLLQKERELSEKNAKLEKLNIAFEVVIEQKNEQLGNLKSDIIKHYNSFVKPYVNELKNIAKGRQEIQYLQLIDQGIRDILSPFAEKLLSLNRHLSPMEMKVANLIRSGLQIQDIATELNVSPHTVKYHRKNIRTKLGIQNQKINLRTYLLQATR